MEEKSEPCEKHKARFRVVLHRPGSSVKEGAKTCENSEQDQSFVYIDSSSNLSSLASKFLQQLYEQSKVEGRDILKASNVKVLIQVRPTWKPLPLSSFVYKQNQSDLSLETVFGPLLHIDDCEMLVHLHLCTEKSWTDETARHMVKKLLQRYSQTQLERLNCPFSQGMLSQISRDQYYCKVSAEKVRLFGLWYDTMMLSKPEDADDSDDSPSKQSSCVTPRSKKIVFSSNEELPLLRASFEEQSHPCTQRMTELAEELNNTEFRKTHGREKVDFRHVNNWFKNERARVRKGNLELSQVTYRTEYSMLGSCAEDDGVLLVTSEESEDNDVTAPV